MRSGLIQNMIGAELPLIEHAAGVWLTDTAGKRYIDGSSGAVVSAIGHSHPHVVAATRAQLEKATFAHRGAFSSAPVQQLAARLTGLTGYAGAWFVNSGSEAVEAAMQFALQYFHEAGHPERQEFLAHASGYHGNTLGALSLSGHARRKVARDLAHPFAVLPAPYAYRDGDGRSDAEYAGYLLESARTHFELHRGTLAGVVVEPVGGATMGATVPPDGYLRGLRELCTEFGALLIADEVMTGLGRTGSVLAVEHWDVHPDIVALGKALGAGYTPIAATLVTSDVLDVINRGSGRILGGHTYSGNPLSAAVATAVLDVIEQEGLIAAGARLAPRLREGLTSLQAKHQLVGDVRGLGMLQALEFVQNRETKEVWLPQGQLAARVAKAVMERGAIVYAATGGFNEAVLVAPPLTIAPSEIDLLVDAIDLGLSDAEAELAPSSAAGAPAKTV